MLSALSLRCRGQLRDGYFLANLGSLLSNEAGMQNVLYNIFVTAEQNPEGVYCVRFWDIQVDEWKAPLLDASLPTYKDYHLTLNSDRLLPGSPCIDKGRYAVPTGARSLAINEMWPCLAEKGWACLIGSYANADFDRVANRSALYNFPLLWMIPHSMPGPILSLSNDLWDDLQRYAARSWPMTITSKPTQRGSQRGGGLHGADSGGIVPKQTFSLLQVLSHVEPGDGHPVRLVKLRNPCGRGEWTGPYSDRDLSRWTPALRQAAQYDPEMGG